MSKETFFTSSNILKALGVIFVGFILFVTAAYVSRQVFYFLSYGVSEEKWVEQYKNIPIKQKYKIVVLLSPVGVTDRAMGKRMIVAAKNLGWEAYSADELQGNEKRINELKPDFIISTLWNLNLNTKTEVPHKIYATLVHPTKTYFGSSMAFKPRFNEEKFPMALRADGYLCSFKVIDLMKNYVELNGKKFHGFRSHPYAQRTKYQGTEPRSLLYTGLNWDKLRSSNRYKILFRKLADQGYLTVYGPKSSWSHVQDAWNGYYEGDAWVVINLLRHYGISLVLHSKRHLSDGIPSGKIFASAAAGAVIITDKNPFVMQEFGDSALYIDQGKSADGMFKEINKHMRWIRDNPKEAMRKAKKAHDIFQEKYTLEDELLRVARMHEKILLEEKEEK